MGECECKKKYMYTFVQVCASVCMYMGIGTGKGRPRKDRKWTTNLTELVRTDPILVCLSVVAHQE